MKIPVFVKSLIVGLPIGVTLLDTVGYVARVDGISMQPALNPDKNVTDYVFLNRWAVRSLEIERGDIISLISPKDPDQKIIKRVVGVQGDIIATLGYKRDVVRVPEGHCWVEGDHTGHSMDSNNFGPVSTGLVTAKASFIVWPPSRWQFIKSFIPDSRVPLNLNRLEFQFNGNVLRNAITLRDVDNDGNYELIVANEKGDVVIFKENQEWQTITGLGFISCIAVGDIFNQKRNCLVVVTGDGWCYIYSCPEEEEHIEAEEVQIEIVDQGVDRVDGQILSGESFESQATDSTNNERRSQKEKRHLKRVHVQRIPANAKYLLLDDIDGDGCVEMVLGLTDRVVRSYRWFDPSQPNRDNFSSFPMYKNGSNEEGLISKLVGLNKWECAKQIGSVTLHHDKDNKPSLLIAQPGGTFMRICYQAEENVDFSDSSSSMSESLTGSSIDYQFLGLSRMRNQNISTEIVGDLKRKPKNDTESDSAESDGSPYAVATLDGTILLVQNEIILWAIAVDHQIFALTKLDVTGNGADDLVACSWDGHTYILDQEKHTVRFQLGESVQAFDSGYYTLAAGEQPVTCFAYVTFHNKILLYYDIPLKEMICRKFSVDVEKIKEVFVGDNPEQKELVGKKIDKNDKKALVEYLLYGIKS